MNLDKMNSALESMKEALGTDIVQEAQRLSPENLHELADKLTKVKAFFGSHPIANLVDDFITVSTALAMKDQRLVNQNLKGLQNTAKIFLKTMEKSEDTEFVAEGIVGQDFNDPKSAMAFLGKASSSYEKDGAKIWSIFKKGEQAWTDHNFSMVQSLVNLRNYLEDKSQELSGVDDKLSDEVFALKRLVDRLEELANVAANSHREGGVAPLGAAKRAMLNFAKNFKSVQKKAEAVLSKVK